MERKKILFYYKLFFTGGTEHSILKLIKKLYEIFDIVVAYDEEETTNTVLKEINKYAEVINLNNIEEISVDVVIWCSHSRSGTFKDFSRKVKAKHYYYWCHLIMFETFKGLEFAEDLRENIEKFICVSDVVKEDIINKYPELEEKCMVLENYLDESQIIEESKEDIDINIDSNSFNLISVSRLSEDKGYSRMKILCDILDKNKINYNWYVLGTAFKQEEANMIKGWFKGNERVHFLGYTDNVFKYISKMDALALLTNRESWGLVITEALILGKPCIVTNFAGVEKQITDDENGVVIKMDNFDNSYEEKILQLYKKQEEYKMNISKVDRSREYLIDIWKEILNK